MKLMTVVFVLAIFNSAFGMPYFPIPVNPDIDLTPGEFCSQSDRDFHGYRYDEHMPYCERNVSQGDKKAVYKKYKIDVKCKHRYTVDHMVPLALGGNNSQENLWPEHALVKETRQDLEQDLYEAVSTGQMTSEDAVKTLLREKTKLQLDLSQVDGCG